MARTAEDWASAIGKTLAGERLLLVAEIGRPASIHGVAFESGEGVLFRIGLERAARARS